jgi:hypothetical protein
LTCNYSLASSFLITYLFAGLFTTSLNSNSSHAYPASCNSRLIFCKNTLISADYEIISSESRPVGMNKASLSDVFEG